MEDLKHQNPNQTPTPSTHPHGSDLIRKPPEPDCTSSTSNQCYTVNLFGVPIAALIIDGQERLCLAQISSTLLKNFSYNEIHNRRVALGITCVQCTPVQLEILRRANAMPVSSRRCGMINKREAERLCKSFLTENTPPKLPDNFSFDVYHECTWGCRGAFVPSRYNSSRAKCIRCAYCNLFSSPNKFIFHAHRTPTSKFHPPDGPNFNSWRRHIKLVDPNPPEELLHAWEDVKAMFNGGSRKRSVCETSNKLTPPSYILKRPADSISLNNDSQRLLPSPPKRSRYDKDPHRDLQPTPPGAVNVPYPLMPIPSRTLSTSISEALPEEPPMNSSPPYSVGAIFPGQLSPSAFRQHPLMEFVWGGGRAGYPLPAAAIWPKTIGMPFAGNTGYYQPFVDPDSDIHAIMDMASSSNNAPSKKPHQGEDFDPLKFGSLKSKTLAMRHHVHHHHLPDLRSRNAYYTSAFRPVLTGKGCLEPERAFGSTERFVFPSKPPIEDCCLAMGHHHARPHQIASHQAKIKADHYPISKSPRSLSPQTPTLIIDADDPADKTDPYSEATTKRTPGVTDGTEQDAGGTSTGEDAKSQRDLGKAHSKRRISMEEAESSRFSPSDSSVLSSRHPDHRAQHHRRHITKESTTPSPLKEDDDHTSRKLGEENQATLSHFSRRLLSSHSVGLD
ncbi:SKI family transcriptional corepressor 1 homolog-B-like [Acanthaster planci]|uniref:SKI family transcriptional corepressor 1 homolog-B-like n=1 Tax=Acanthaster planci TaxID=133434 RepID=A0A8B7Y3B1_ACAPL|nr:SKI family transcriptional corepressor 1 homolog-B-like [Acanthaster planci]